MVTFNFDNFYYTPIDVENYDEIIKELRVYVLTKLDQIGANFYSGLIRVPEPELLNSCPQLLNWFNKNDMELIMSAVHIMQAHSIGQLHSDSDGSRAGRLALNFDIENADVTKTKLYEVSIPGTSHATRQKLSYIVYQNNADTCKQVTEYDLSKPVLFDNVKPHSVTNHTNSRRVALTLRFRNDPVHLLTGRP